LLGAVGSYYNQGSIILINQTEADLQQPDIVTNEITPTIPDDWPGNKADYYRQSYDNNYMGTFVKLRFMKRYFLTLSMNIEYELSVVQTS